MQKLSGGRPNVYFSTSLGPRYVDQLANGIIYESKVGEQAGSFNKLLLQMKKDHEIVNGKEIKEAIWYFFRNPNTGKIATDPKIFRALEKYGIKYVIYDK